MTALKLVVFDVDGTLVDSRAIILAAMRGAYAAEGLSAPDEDVILSIVGLSLIPAIATLSPDASADMHATLAAQYKATYTHLRASGAEDAALFPGAQDLLAELAAVDDILLGVATGKSRRGLNILLEKQGLEGTFLTTQTADEHPSKPHPSMLETCLRETGVTARNAVIIGDTSFDIEMGHAADYRTIGVNWGYHPIERLQAAKAHRIVEDMSALKTAIFTELEG